jgi:hypothetical protein
VSGQSRAQRRPDRDYSGHSLTVVAVKVETNPLGVLTVTIAVLLNKLNFFRGKTHFTDLRSSDMNPYYDANTRQVGPRKSSKSH